MKAIIALFTLASSVAFANPVSIQTLELRSPKTNGVYKLTISPAADGKLGITIDPNHCGNPGPCTAMAISHEVVEAKVIKDNRPVDGELLLSLTPSINLSVGSGYNLDNHVAITAILINPDGTTTKLPLTAEVSVQVEKQ